MIHLVWRCLVYPFAACPAICLTQAVKEGGSALRDASLGQKEWSRTVAQDMNQDVYQVYPVQYINKGCPPSD